MKNIISSLKIFIDAHRAISSVIGIAILISGYWTYGKITATTGEAQYVLENAKKGAIITSISGSGQVSASNQIDLKAKTSGDIVYFSANAGQKYAAGTLLVKIDTRNAEKIVRDAEINFEQAKLDLEKMKGLTTSEGSVRGVKEKAVENIDKAYEDGFNKVADAFLEFPAVMSGLQDILYSKNSTLGGSSVLNVDFYSSAAARYDANTINADKADQYKNDAIAKYAAARNSYDKNFNDYKSTSRFSDKSNVENLINETYDTTKDMAEAVKSVNNLIQYYKDKLTANNLTAPAIADIHLASLNSYTGKTNSYLVDFLSVKTTIQTNKENLVLTDFDIADQQIKVSQAENTLIEAKDALKDCYVYTPFSGTLAKVNIKKGDTLSNGTTIGTFITEQKIAEISLNEVDVAKVKIGQKVTLTFDAIEGLSIAGTVSGVDTIGTVSQGVVTYNVKINFDTQDARVKSGMSVSASVITSVKQDILTVPNSAVKSQGDSYYVEMFSQPIQNPNPQGNASAIIPDHRTVEIGISNDELTEILSGLNEGDQVVTRTIAPSSAVTTQAPSILGAIGGNRGASGAVRSAVR